jgi:hypothetical protein
MKHKDDNKVWALWLLLEFVAYIISSDSLNMIGVGGQVSTLFYLCTWKIVTRCVVPNKPKIRKNTHTHTHTHTHTWTKRKHFDERDKSSFTTTKGWGDESSFVFVVIKVS